jgi:hypothetical protein
MNKWFAENAPAMQARLIGALYLISGEAFTFAENKVRGKLVDLNDAAATAHNILTHQTLYRQGLAAEAAPLYLIVTLLLYWLLKPVNKNLSMAAAVFSMAGCIVQAVNVLLHAAPLILLTDAHLAAVLPAAQLQGMALFSLKLAAEGTNLFMLFFGCYCFLLGCLILRARFMPRIIGAFLTVAGSAYLFSYFAAYLAPALEARIYPNIILWPGIAGEGSLILWLLIMGVNARRWREQAGAGRVCIDAAPVAP